MSAHCFCTTGQIAPRQPAAVLVLGMGGRQAAGGEVVSERRELMTVFC